MFVFFFFKQKTAYEMRISDWSSDVCSSDLCQSRHEGFGIAPIEAMSAGLTPILSDIPPFRNLIEKSNLGILLEGDDEANHMQKIIALHEQGDAAYAARRAAAQHFVPQYIWRARTSAV